jgi:hypothetical protein
MTTEMPSQRSLFNHYRTSLELAGIRTAHADSLVCPLCWQETRYDDLSIEHAVPSSIGGTATVLTCRRCNNDHGSSLDAHLSQFQSIADAFQGHGAIPTELNINGKRLVANLEWGNSSKNLKVVGKASDLRMQDQIKADFQSGKVKEINVAFSFGYSKNRFQTAVLRAAYLVLFKCFGYQYVRHEVVQVLRRRICDTSLEYPRIGSIIAEFRDCKLPVDEPHLIAPANINGVQFLLVIIRVRKQTTTYLAVFMPVPADGCDRFFDLMEQRARDHDGERFAIPPAALFT